jgi:hypothetical protein
MPAFTDARVRAAEAQWHRVLQESAMQAIPASRIPRSDLPRDVALIDPALVDHIEWNGRRFEVVGTTRDARLVTALNDEDE